MVTWQITKPHNELLCLQPHHFLLSFSGNYLGFFSCYLHLYAHIHVRTEISIYLNMCQSVKYIS